MATRMLQRRGTAAEWAAENPVLADGEIGYARDTKTLKVGDGVTAWNALRTTWVDQSVIDAKGDLLVGSGPDAYARVPVGADSTFLIADSTQPQGVKWAASLVALAIGGGLVAGTQLTVSGQATNTVPALVTGIAGQTNDLQQWWTTPAGPTVAAITKDGGIVARSVDTQVAGGGIYSGGGLYNKGLEAIITGYGGTTQRARLSDDGTTFYFQTDHPIVFAAPYSGTQRVRIDNDGTLTATQFKAGGLDRKRLDGLSISVSTDNSWNSATDSGTDCSYHIFDGYGRLTCRLYVPSFNLTPFSAAVSVYLPFNTAGSRADRNNCPNARPIGRFKYMRNDRSAVFEGTVFNGEQNNSQCYLVAAGSSTALVLTPAQFDRLFIDIFAPVQ